MTFVLSSSDGVDPGRMGGKAAALSLLAGTGMKIPAWFVITPGAFEASLSTAQRRSLLRAEGQVDLEEFFDRVSPAPQVLDEVEGGLATLGDDSRFVAVRSSGVQEDGVEHSFAGQFESYLSVTRKRLPARITGVWRSGFSERLLAYRRENDLEGLPQAPAVLVQVMVDSETAGVAFSADPVTGRRSVAVVSTLYGLGTALVGGDADADTYRVHFDGTILEREIAAKSLAHRPAPDSPEGFAAQEIPEPAASRPALTDGEAASIAELARRAERHLGRPQDIEWAMLGGEIFLLQSRPITSLAARPDPDGVRIIWDNSNIVESYSGITTPLTFSFALHAYDGVYREFCRLLGVTKGKIAANDLTFRRMLGLVRGRVYYNLLNWYRVIALLPGYSFNRRFMEQMMGVRESLPDEITASASSASRPERVLDLLRLGRTVAGMAVNHVRLPGMTARFEERLDRALAPRGPPLEAMRLDQLTADYRALESNLLTRWDAPLINDFYAMVFFGVLGRLTSRWCGGGEKDEPGSLHNDLVCGQGGMISAEPARRIVEMATVAARHSELTEVLCQGAAAGAEQDLRRQEELARLYDDYLATFGDRCLDELKLESTTLLDDPEPLLRSIGHAAARLARGQTFDSGHQSAVRKAAEEKVRRALARRPLRRAVFGWVLRNARQRVRDRENLRFERTRIFGRARRIFLEVGRRLFAEGVLDAPRDVFYLEREEILAYAEGASPCDDLRGLASVRRRAFEGYAELEAPANRFETFGPPYIANSCQGSDPGTGEQGEAGGEDVLRGLGCCPGVVRGRARVIRDPRGAELKQGEILVAERTDPGWIMLFPAAAGILVERGSLLSHSAIVSREMGIPAIVAIAGLTTRIRSGCWIEMDGARGRVSLNPPQPEAGPEQGDP